MEYSDEWSSYNLGELLTFYSTNSFSREKLNYESGSVKNIHYGDIHTKYPSILSIENNKEVPFINNDLDLSKFSEDQYLQEGDLIIADASEDYEDIGKAIEVKNINNEKVLAGLHTILARDEKNMTVNGFKAYLFSTNNLKTKIKIIANGISVLGISKNNLSKINVKIPSKNEQRDIVSFISDIDKKIELLERKHQSYLEFKNYLMKQIFTQKLRFAEFEDDWIPYKIGDISKTYSGGTPSTSKKEYYEGNIPFIKSGEINNDVTEQYITEDALKNSSAKRVQKGDLLLALYGATSGEVAISKIDGAINQAVLKIDNNMDNYFQYCYFLMYKDQIVHKYIQGGQGNLSANIIKKLEFKYPSLAEQKKISQFFMSFDNKLELYENKIIKYNNLKKGLLQQMFGYVHIILNFCVKICCIKYLLNST
ncbi:restriction endonuclease subunit S [Methanobrevibacter sp.]|uniref:restriction endonuclease subunit S n=1 Tax=Methanobrevibacter sp. TaxID=66852 RepID=UPI0025E7C93A|nr:restriction endonuclease subunit S [Methanobrevibacter sp.]